MPINKWLGGTGGNTTNASTAGNWSLGSVPVNGDDIYVEANPSGTDFNIATGLTALQAVHPASINISQTYTGQIGTTSAYLQIGSSLTNSVPVNIGYQYGGVTQANGSNLIRLDLGSLTVTGTIYNSARTSALAGAGPITILNHNASSVLSIINGTISVANDPSETTELATVNSGGNLFIGSGVTFATANINGGSAQVRTAVTTVNLTAGTFYTFGTGAITTFNANGGTSILNSTGTISALNVYAAAVDLSQNPNARTITTTTLYNGANLNFNNGVKSSITFTNGLAVKASAGQYKITPWPNTNLALS